MLKVQLGVKDTLFLIPRNAHSFIKVRGSITVPSTSCKTGLDMAVVDINKNFLYYPVRPAFWDSM